MDSPTKNNKQPYCDFIRNSLPSWSTLFDDEMDFHLFSSLSNKVFKVTANSETATPKVVILRHFNEQEGIVDQAKEVKVFAAMSKSGFGPECYGHEGNFRLEQYIPSRNINAREYKEKTMRRKLARTMAALHGLQVADIDKTSLFAGVLVDEKYFEKFDEKCAQDFYTPEEKEVIRELNTCSSAEEREFLKKILPKDDVVFSHNDLLSGNVLITSEKEDVVFIDYEYAAYNFRGFDIGNMFKEATFDYTYPNTPYFQILTSNFPNDEEFKDFLRYYIVFTEMDLTANREKTDTMLYDDEIMQSHIEKHFDAETLNKRIEDLKRECKIGMMFSFYYWCIWGVNMHKSSEAQFDYLEFARQGHENFKKLKAELFGQ